MLDCDGCESDLEFSREVDNQVVFFFFFLFFFMICLSKMQMFL